MRSVFAYIYEIILCKSVIKYIDNANKYDICVDIAAQRGIIANKLYLYKSRE